MSSKENAMRYTPGDGRRYKDKLGVLSDMDWPLVPGPSSGLGVHWPITPFAITVPYSPSSNFMTMSQPG